MGDVAQALISTLSPGSIMLLMAATFAGMVVGALPGLTATMALALLVPFTFAMEPATGLVVLGALFVGAMYGDAIPACLINTPGTAAAVATTFDGFPMTQQGKGQSALVASCTASFIGAVGGGLALLLLSPPLAALSLRIGPPEFFWIGVFALTIIGALSGSSLLKGLGGGTIGLALSLVGVAPAGGATRFTLGLVQFQAGVSVVAALVGLFAIPQLVRMVEERHTNVQRARYTRGRGVAWATVKEVLSRPMHILRANVIGVVVGILPGAGPPIASLISYSEGARWAKDKESFGKGNVHGVTASEIANNASGTASMIPLLTLGVPGSAPAAIIMGALMLHGLQPGAQLYAQDAVTTYSFIWGMLLAGPAVLLLGSSTSKYIARMIDVPVHYLVPTIFLLCIVGSFALRNNRFDVYVMLAIGLFAYLLSKVGFLPGPIALGLILGPIIEGALVTSLAIAQASSIWHTFFARPLSALFILLTALSVVWTLASRRTSKNSMPVREA